MKSDEVKKLSENEVKKLFPEQHLFLCQCERDDHARADKGDHRH